MARCVVLCIRRRYVKHHHNCQRSATRPQTVARAPRCPQPAARAACEPRAAGDGCCITSCVVVKRWRKRSVQAVLRSRSQGRFFAAGAWCVPLHERRRGACAFFASAVTERSTARHVQRRAASGASAATLSASSSFSLSIAVRSVSVAFLDTSSRLGPVTGFLSSLCRVNRLGCVAPCTAISLSMETCV